jgi:hypothetical protein
MIINKHSNAIYYCVTNFQKYISIQLVKIKKKVNNNNQVHHHGLVIRTRGDNYDTNRWR